MRISALRVTLDSICVTGEGPEGSVEQTMPGPLTFDILNGTSEPVDASIGVMAGAYDEFEISLEFASTPAAASISMDGVYEGPEGQVELRVRIESDDSLESSWTTVQFQSDLSIDPAVVFEPERWLGAVNLSSVPSASGYVLIEDDSSEQWITWEAALQQSLQQALVDGLFTE